jgi:uncharacterized membrane protein YgcG
MSRSSVFMGLTVLLVCSLNYRQAHSAVAHAGKMAPPILKIAEAVASGHSGELMKSSITRQFFHANSPLEARWNSQGQIQISIYYDRMSVTPDINALSNMGATDVHVTPLMGVVQAWVPSTQLSAIAGMSWVRRLVVPQYTITNGLTSNIGIAGTSGDQSMGAATFRQSTGDTGQGITVGVINAGDTGLSQSQSTGDLPSNVWVDPSYPGISDGEGTAMMEIVHDLAPGSALAFCGAQTSADYLNCLSDLQNHGAQVIVDDMTFPITAYFTHDSDVTAVQEWTSQHPSTRLVTSSGNFATSFWSGTYNPAAINPITVNGVTYNEAQNFGTSASPNFYEQITVQPASRVEYILEWADPWVPTANITSSTPDDPNDYDIVLYDSNYNIIACNQGMTSDQTGCSQAGAASSSTPGPQPGIGNLWANTSSSAVNVYLAIFYRAGTPSNQLKLFVASTDSCPVTLSSVTPSDSIFGQATLPYPSEISVGAIRADLASQGQYELEPFSSEGPVYLPLLSEVPIQKPDFVGVDGVSISGAGGFPPAECGQPAPSPPIFYGTSAAAPHVAALIALLESAGYTSDQVYGVLQSNAKQLTSNGSGVPNGLFGYGFADIASVKAVNNSSSGSSSSNTNSGTSSGSSSGGGGGFAVAAILLLVLCGIMRKWIRP